MKDTDLDLLLALIEGRLAAGDDAAAQARVSEDPELQTELDMQRLVVARLDRLPRPSLSTEERDHLHADLRRQLHLAPVAAPVAAPRSPWWSHAWSRWVTISGVAVAAVVLVGLVYVVPRTGDESPSPTDVVAADLLETEAGASPQAEERSAAAESEGSPDVGGSQPSEPTPPGDTASPGDESGDSLAPLNSTATPPAAQPPQADEGAQSDTVEGTVASGTTTASEAGLITVGDLGGDVPAAADLLEDLGGETADEQHAIEYFLGGGTTTIDSAEFDACAGSLDAVGGGRNPVPVAAGARGGEEVVVVVFAATSDAPFTVAIVATNGCDVVDSASAVS